MPDAPDKGGPAPREPRQAEEIDARLRRYAAVMLWPLCVIEGVDLQPAIVGGVARRPDDGADPGLGQIETEQRVGNAGRIGQKLAGGGLFGQVHAVAGHPRVRGVEQRKVGGIAAADILRQVGVKQCFVTVKAAGLPH